MTEPSEPWSRKEKFTDFLKLITVEPTMILYMMAFMTTTVVEQAFFVYKACTVDHNLNKTVCDNISDEKYSDINKEVQITVSTFHLWNDVGGHVGQIILAFFMGAWSDKRGRKITLLLGLIGKLYYSFMVVINALQPTWPLMYVVYTATIPMAFTGADVAIFSAAFSYIADISNQESRTMRVTILEVCYLATMPTGIALGSYLFRKVVNQSYSIMFTINCTLLVLAIFYSLIRLKWRTNPRQRPLREASNIFLDFFDYNHVIKTARTLYKKRPKNRRRYLIMLIIMMAFYTFQRDEKNIMYLYVKFVFKWDYVKKFSDFKIFQSALQDLFLLLMVPLLSRVLGWRDTFIVMIGALSHSAARLFYATADSDLYFYIGGVFAAFGPIVAPVLRSMVSKMVSNTEKGKAFSVLSVADNAIPIVSGTLYSLLYNHTLHDHPNAFFFLTIATQMSVFIMIIYIHFNTKDEDLIHETEELARSSIENEQEASQQT
ncbi:proton-coupled folate transporter isoform X2 [Aethina tumida]|nr:proton-coupled folate transporter isoform X2 [Aethina tumida]XP_019870844.2 proton-coupled folate transporter isoform X2 [Aethina tumida]